MTFAAVVGRPVGHSKSPLLMKYMLKQTGTKGNYFRLIVRGWDDLNHACKELGLTGVNVTAPFKEKAAQWAARRDKSVTQVHAANLLVHSGGEWLALNSDIFGIEQALRQVGAPVTDQTVLILGAGGAAAAAAKAVQHMHPSSISLWNRSPEKAGALCNAMGLNSVPAGKLQSAVSASRVIISCLPRQAEVLAQLIFQKHQFVMDANYGLPGAQEHVERQGAEFVDGRDWLIFQALPSFTYLFGSSFEPTENDLNHLRREIDKPLPAGPIFFTGFMGSGKTTLARMLADRLNRPFVDLDAEIEAYAGMKIRDIFERHDEHAFRQMETAMLKKVATEVNAIIATGGGVVEREENREVLKNGRTFLLWRPLTHITPTLDTSNRPRWDVGHMEKLLDKRKKYYLDSAHVIVYNTGAPGEMMEILQHEIY